jgi:broad specificity phosphatase PhoE
MRRYDEIYFHTTIWQPLVTAVSGVAVGFILATIHFRGRTEPTKLSQNRTTFRGRKSTAKKHEGGYNDCYQQHRPGDRGRRGRLPELVVLVRHGESEGNADETLYRTRPDHAVNLTPRGVEQALEAGERLERDVFQAYEDETGGALRRVHLTVSPFERTLQTASALRIRFDHRVVRTDIEPRIREQEFGNVQTSEFQQLRAEQKRIGRFWYRFPTGESGADVYGRVKSWWFESVLTVNERAGYEPVDAVVVVTHGLTMRFVLMQLYGWSPTTFHSVWNAGNCDMYCLRKCPSKPGLSPYVLDPELGDMPKSSIEVRVEFCFPSHRELSDKGMNPNEQWRWTRTFTLHDYLSIPSPRTRQLDIILRKLREQYPQEFRDIDRDGGGGDDNDSNDASSNRTASFHSVALTPFVVNQGGDHVWNLIDTAKQSFSRRMTINAITASSHVSSVTSASASSTSVHHSFADSAEFPSSATGERVSDRDTKPRTAMQCDDDDASSTTTNSSPSPRCSGTRASMQQQEFSCRFPEFDYWQLGHGSPLPPSASTDLTAEGSRNS